MDEQPLEQLRTIARQLRADARTAASGQHLARLADELAQRLQQAEQERQELGERLALAGRLAELGTMAAAVFHEMNQPLVGIKGFAELVRDQLAGGKAERAAEWLEEIRKQVARVQDMQQRVTSFLRPDPSGAARAVQLEPAVSEALKLFHNRLTKKRVEVQVDIPADLPALGAKPQHLVQILVNLAGNALDALEPLGQDEQRRLWITAAPDPDDQTVRILVADNGTGISPADRPRLFEPFFSTKAERGTGLGLAVSGRLAELNDGRLALLEPQRSGLQPAPSTVFELRLPVAAAAGPDEADPPAPAAGDSSGDRLAQLDRDLLAYSRQVEVSRRVLLVDDEPAALQELTETLAQHGILADLATSGEEALERVADREYAVLLAGLKLPDMDGIELMQRAHRSRPAMEAVICTRSESLDEVLAAFERGASDYLPKPYPSRPFISWKVRGALARYEFEIRTQAYILFLKRGLEAQASGQGHDVTTSCVIPLKRALESYQQDPGPPRIALAGPVGLVRAARNLGYETAQVGDLAELLERVKQGEAQVVVAVEEDGGLEGVEVITRVWRLDPDCGVFVVAPEKKLQALVQAIGTGIGDTLLRPLEGRELFAPRLGRLVARQQRVVRYQRLLTELKSLNIHLMDPATRPR